MMTEMQFDNIEDFCYEIMTVCDEMKEENDIYDDFRSVGIIAKYDDAKSIVNYLISEEFDICTILLESPIWEGYIDEYLIDICDRKITVTPMKNKNKYCKAYNDIVYILDDCVKTAYPYVKSNIVFDIIFEDGEYEDKDEPYSHSINKKNEKYFVNGKETDKDTYAKSVLEFDEMFKDVLKDALLEHSRIMDRFNDLLASRKF